MIKRSWLVIIIGFFLAIVLLLSLIQNEKNQNTLHYETFCSEKGWGYNILTGDKVLLHQDVVPVVDTQKGFKYEDEAERAAGLVIKKIRMKKFPGLKKSEIEPLLSSNEAY